MAESKSDSRQLMHGKKPPKAWCFCDRLVTTSTSRYGVVRCRRPAASRLFYDFPLHYCALSLCFPNIPYLLFTAFQDLLFKTWCWHRQLAR